MVEKVIQAILAVNPVFLLRTVFFRARFAWKFTSLFDY